MPSRLGHFHHADLFGMQCQRGLPHPLLDLFHHSGFGQSPCGDRNFASRSQARRHGYAVSCSLSLRSFRFFPLLSTPPRGDAVTSSSHQPDGGQWPGSSTPEECAAPQRTSVGILPASHAGETPTLVWPNLTHF